MLDIEGYYICFMCFSWITSNFSAKVVIIFVPVNFSREIFTQIRNFNYQHIYNRPVHTHFKYRIRYLITLNLNIETRFFIQLPETYQKIICEGVYSAMPR